MLENSQVEPATVESGASATRLATARAHLAGAVLRRHWLAAVLLAAGLALRVLAQFAYRPALRSEEHTSELQSLRHLVCRLLLEKKKSRKSRVRQRMSTSQYL